MVAPSKMQFASLTYLVLLCLTFGIYWGIPRRRVQNVVILLSQLCLLQLVGLSVLRAHGCFQCH